MAKKRREKPDKKVIEKQKLPDTSKPTEADNTESEKPFDFGGFPDRDLKKNLGCG